MEKNELSEDKKDLSNEANEEIKKEEINQDKPESIENGDEKTLEKIQENVNNCIRDVESLIKENIEIKEILKINTSSKDGDFKNSNEPKQKNKKIKNEEFILLMNNDNKFLYMMITLGTIILGLICTIIILFKIQMDTNKLCYSPPKHNQFQQMLPQASLPQLDSFSKDTAAIQSSNSNKEINLGKELEKVENTKVGTGSAVVFEMPNKK